MIKKLLVVFAAAALISMACFTILGVIGGFPPAWGPGGPPWLDRNRADAGPQITRNLPFTGADRLQIGYPAEITVTQGAEPRFTVTGPKDVLDRLQLEGGAVIWNGRGRRGWRWGPWGRRGDGRLHIDIVSPAMHEFDLSGAQKLTLRNFDQDSLRLTASGAADVEGQGRAKRLEAHVSGAGHLDLEDLSVDDAEVSISGAGDVNIDARHSAEASISGAGHVHLRCRPQQGLYPHISGFGSIDDGGSSCASEPPPGSSAAPTAPAAPAQPAPKSNV